MSFFSSMFGGSGTQKMPTDPTFERYNEGLYNYDPGLGATGKYYKQLMKRIGQGGDVSDYGELESERQRAATERRGIEEDYGSGALALESNAGGAQAPLIQRMKEMSLDRASERHGMNLQRGYTDLRREATGGFENARQTRIQAELAAKQGATGNQLGYVNYLNRLVQKPGWLNTLANVAGAAGGLATGVGALGKK